MTERELALRREIMVAFAETGEPPAVDDRPTLEALVERHVVVLGDDGGITMAHPFSAPGGNARIDASGRTWWGNCAWDALGIVAALGLPEATIANNGMTVRVRDGRVLDDAVFHVSVPARHWWDDVEYT
jgi:hypothetical protein